MKKELYICSGINDCNFTGCRHYKPHTKKYECKMGMCPEVRYHVKCKEYEYEYSCKIEEAFDKLMKDL